MVNQFKCDQCDAGYTRGHQRGRNEEISQSESHSQHAQAIRHLEPQGVSWNGESTNEVLPKCSREDSTTERHAKKGNDGIWGQLQDDAFDKLKTDLSSNRVLALYNPERETVVSADASIFGLGAVIMQEQP